MDKLQLRMMMKEKLKLMTPDLYNIWSVQIAKKLYELDEWKNANVIGITISRGTEVYTRSIIEKGWQENKQMVVPKCDPVKKEMTFRILESFAQLEVIYFGLEEPIESKTKPVLPNEIELLIVPGLAFNEYGQRLGFGGGYYDRFLNRYNGNTIALAFQLQMVNSIPIEEHDRTIGMIITNEQVISCR